MPFYAIAAMSENRVIGDQGRMPWHLPDEYRWFKHKTMGGTLVMGRKTFESLGKPLPGRKTVVLTKRVFQYPGVDTVSSDDAVADLIHGENIPGSIAYSSANWICGGGTIYTQFLKYCDYLYLTTVKRRVEGDAFFPSAAQVQKSHTLDQIIHDGPQFRVERWASRNLPVTARLAPEKWPFPAK